MTQQYTIKQRENPFQFHASEFLGDFPNLASLQQVDAKDGALAYVCLLYTSPSPRDRQKSRMPSSA